MNRPTKYVKGLSFDDVGELDVWLRSGGWVYMGHKVQHPNWVMSMRLKTVSDWVHSGHVFRARERAVLEELAVSA